MDFLVKGADLFTCREHDALLMMGLSDANAQSLLLPSTGTWVLDGSLAEAVRRSRPISRHAAAVAGPLRTLRARAAARR